MVANVSRFGFPTRLYTCRAVVVAVSKSKRFSTGAFAASCQSQLASDHAINYGTCSSSVSVL